MYGVGSLEDVDLLTGGLLDTGNTDAGVTDVFRAILVDQMTRLRDGDRFWYANTDNG